jgi:hypothetical protein
MSNFSSGSIQEADENRAKLFESRQLSPVTSLFLVYLGMVFAFLVLRGNGEQAVLFWKGGWE